MIEGVVVSARGATDPRTRCDQLAEAAMVLHRIGRNERVSELLGEAVAQTGIIPGAVHVTRGMLEFRADPQSPLHDPVFSKDRTVVLYCASGGRAALAGKALLDLGYADVRNLGGLGAWTKTGGPVEGTDSDDAKGA